MEGSKSSILQADPPFPSGQYIDTLWSERYSPVLESSDFHRNSIVLRMEFDLHLTKGQLALSHHEVVDDVKKYGPLLNRRGINRLNRRWRIRAVLTSDPSMSILRMSMNEWPFKCMRFLRVCRGGSWVGSSVEERAYGKKWARDWNSGTVATSGPHYGCPSSVGMPRRL